MYSYGRGGKSEDNIFKTVAYQKGGKTYGDFLLLLIESRLSMAESLLI